MLLEWLWSAMGFVGTLATKRVVDRSVDRALQAKSPVPRLSVIRDYQEVPAGSVRQLFGRVKVIAVGKGTLRNVRGYLCGIERLSGGRPIKKIFTETFPLIWSYDEHVDSRDVVEGVPWTMDVVMCQEG